MASNEQYDLFELSSEPVIKGYPELRWTGKRPYRSTQYYPAQLKESFGDPKDGWMNKIFWGDNLQVMSHMLKEYRGKIDLIYIDPPFDSKADYKKTIKLKGKKVSNDPLAFEEKQYGDIWSSDEYLQFMYERLVLMRELLADTGSIYLHCDWHRSAYLRLILDEVFGSSNFRNEIVWSYFGFKRATSKKFPQKHDVIYCYTKSSDYTWNVQYKPHSEDYIKRFKKDASGRLYRDDVNPTGGGSRIIYLDEVEGDIIDSVWDDIPPVNPVAKDRQNYPTQKPVKLVERIINASTNPGDLLFDCFIGSGTTPAAAINTNRRFIGADINLGAIRTTTKRLALMLNEGNNRLDFYETSPGFEVFNVNNYDFFRNPVEARDLILSALDIQPFAEGNVFDGELDGRMVKILPANRIATKADLKALTDNLPYSVYDERKFESPSTPVDHITLVCMGHEPDLKAAFEQELDEYVIDVEIVDILRDKKGLEFKREAEARIEVEGGTLVIKSFYPLNLLQKLSLQKESVDDWRELVESVMIDWNYDGAVMEPSVIDIPEKQELVSGVYTVPSDAGVIKVKITDVLSESLEVEVR